MHSVGNSIKKIIGAIIILLLFLIIVCMMIFGVGVAINYVETGELTYEVAPVTTIMKLMDKESEKGNVVQSEQNGAQAGQVKPTEVNKDNLDNSLVQVVENVMPAIVSVECTVEVKSQDDFYAYFYGGGGTTTAISSGSGIIIAQNSQEILIVTNNHVVEGAKEVKIIFNDGKSYVAQIKGCDSTSDLAVLSVAGKDISDSTLDSIMIATLGNSDNLSVGDTSIAIGNSMGYGQSVTRGVISALDRSVTVEDSTMRLIQTDAAINPGNSGGALLNSRGEVIGINSVKYISDTTESIGYAIPISTAVPIINELINYEEISEDEQAYFGIVAYTVSDSMASYFNCSKGAYIKVVTENSPAEEAGLVAGDVITEFDGRSVSSMEEIESILKLKRGGDKCTVVFERLESGEYKEHEVSVIFGNKGDYDE